MSDYKTEVIILRSWKSKEYDRIYSVFSREYGRMKVVGVGTRKTKAKLASGLEPLTRSDIFLVKCRALDRVKGVIVLRMYNKLKQNLTALIILRKTVIILENLFEEGTPNEIIFIVLKDFLKEVDILANEGLIEVNYGRGVKLNHKLRLLQLALLWKMIHQGGFFPEFKKCFFCHRKLKEQVQYDFIFSQGVSCGCQQWFEQELKIHLSKNVIKLIRFFIAHEMNLIIKLKINTEDLRELIKFTKLILERVLERKIDF